MSQGRLLHIHTAPRTGRPMVSLETAIVVADQGIEGDRYATGKGKYSHAPEARGVTLFAIEAIRELKKEHGVEMLAHEHRRNLTTEGIALSDLVGKAFTVGGVTMEGLRPCKPCRYLNMMSKKQIFTLLMDRAGLYCRVVSEGTIKVGDPINLS